MTQRIYAIFIFFVAILVLFSPLFLAPVHAQQPQFTGDTGPSGIVPCGDPGEPPCQACHLVELAQDGLNFIVYSTVFVATLLFAYAGFLYISAGGSTEQISKATGIFRNVIIGFIIVAIAWLVIDSIMKTFLDSSKFQADFGPWNQIKCVTKP